MRTHHIKSYEMAHDILFSSAFGVGFYRFTLVTKGLATTRKDEVRVLINYPNRRDSLLSSCTLTSFLAAALGQGYSNYLATRSCHACDYFGKFE